MTKWTHAVMCGWWKGAHIAHTPLIAAFAYCHIFSVASAHSSASGHTSHMRYSPYCPKQSGSSILPIIYIHLNAFMSITIMTGHTTASKPPTAIQSIIIISYLLSTR